MSSKFLDKTGLDTLWAKIKSTFQTLGNLVTAWGSTPSDTKYPSEKLVKTSLDAISTNARTIPQDISKGANLVVNCSGRMSSNYNFSGFLYIPTITNNGSAGSFGFSATTAEDEYISCDFNKKIVFSADVKNLVAQPSNCVHRIYVAEYDIDKKIINATQVTFGVGTLTELTQDLNPGDTVVHFADLSGAKWIATEAYRRGFIFWNYTNSYGYLYPPETYSRNVYIGASSTALYENANVDVSAGTITLNSGWTGPAIPAGTKVSRRNSGNTYPYPATVTASDTNWHTLKGSLQGIVEPGTSERGAKFSQGTAFVRVGVYPTNLNNADEVTGKRAVVANLAVYEEQSLDDGGGVLSVSHGGTGRSSVTAGYYLVGAGSSGTDAFTQKTAKQVGNNVLPALDAGSDNVLDTDYIIASNHTSGATDTTAFVRRTADKLWNYIKGQISSVLGLTATSYGGNATTATTATTAAGYTSGGAIDTALQSKQDSSNAVTFTKNTSISVAGTTKDTYTYDQSTMVVKNGIVIGGTAAAAGLVTRGICGVSSPDSTTGACAKDNVYINYDGDSTYRSSRQVVLQAGTVGTHYGNNLYQYAAARGDAVKDYSDAHYVGKETGKGLSTNDFTDTYKSNVDSNTSARHTHSNKTVLDGISSTDVTNWDGKQDGLGISSSGSTTKFLNEKGQWATPTGTGAKEKSYYSSGSWRGVKFATTTVTNGDSTSYGVFQFTRLQKGTGIKTLGGSADKPIVGIVQIFHRTNSSGETVAGNVMARITVFQSDFTGQIRVYFKINGTSVDWYIATTTTRTYVSWRTLKLFSYGTVNDIDLSGVNDVSTLTENNASYKTPLVATSSTGTGSGTNPVYVDENGRLVACSDYDLSANAATSSYPSGAPFSPEKGEMVTVEAAFNIQFSEMILNKPYRVWGGNRGAVVTNDTTSNVTVYSPGLASWTLGKNGAGKMNTHSTANLHAVCALLVKTSSTSLVYVRGY